MPNLPPLPPTANEVNRSLRTRKGRSFWRAASLTFLGSLTVAAILIAVAPIPANDDDKNRSVDNDKGIRAEIAALQGTVSALQSQVNTLQSQLAAVQSNPVLALGPFVTVDPNPEVGVIGPNIIFKGANIHIISGMGTTNDNGNPSGLGNLIIGYDEGPDVLGFPALNAGDQADHTT